MSKKITRSTVNDEQYSAPQYPTSGFPLSYRRYSSFALGRIHIGGFHYVMAGDKISGKTSGRCTFKRIVTPLVSPVNAMQYNIYLPFRPLDRSFKKGVTPTKLNAMSANWTMPLFNTRYLVDQILRAYFNGTYNQSPIPTGLANVIHIYYDMRHELATDLASFAALHSVTLDDFLYGSDGAVSVPLNSLTDDNGVFAQMADKLYMRDALLDIAESISAKLGSSDFPLSGSMLLPDFLNLYLSTLLEPFVGRYSYYGELKYEFLRPFDFYRLSRGLTSTTSEDTYTQFLSLFSDTNQNEYAIRAMYAVWYELFRNVDLEPVSSTLPDWQEWSSTSIFDMSAGGNLCYLLYRIRAWEKDMFISAQIDDMSRHVYAPIFSGPDSSIGGHPSAVNNLDTNPISHPIGAFDVGVDGSKPSIFTLSYQDQLSNSQTSIQCPVPSNVNDVLSALDTSFYEVYGLDLNTLRQSHMLERYLKRNYLFGDEYQDRMLAHYNSRVSDGRVNKPEILSQSMNGYDMGQEVSNVSTSAGSSVGDRTATGEINVNGTEYTTYCEEFGIVLSLVCFMPRAMYDGSCPQIYMSKQIDLPLPEFAANNEEFGRKLEIAGSGLAPTTADSAEDNRYMFGRYPAYHAWRSRVDEVGGEFLDELQDTTFRRFFGMFSDDTTPKLNYFFIHCRPNLNMFADNILYDMQLYGDLVHDCYVERVLPVPVETI